MRCFVRFLAIFTHLGSENTDKMTMKNWLQNLSLAQKITFLTLGFCVSSALAILLVVYYSIVDLNESILNNELNAHKTIMSRAYIEPMWSFDKIQIEEVSNSFLDNQGFASVVGLKVVDLNGNVLFYKNKLLEGPSGPALEDSPEFTKTGESLIKKNGEILGRVYVTFSTDSIMSKHRNTLGSICLITLIILGFISIGINLLFNKLLTTPLNRLLDHIRQIRNQNYETKEYPTHSHEMQLISNALNYTSHLIKKRNSDLKNHTDNLEKIVAERTSELENQVMKNLNVSRLVAVGEVASGIAHEINNPLTVINGQVLKLKRITGGFEHELDYTGPLSKISLMSERIVKIINGLKLISRDGHGDPMVEFSVSKMVEEIMLLTDMKIKSTNISLDVHIDSSIEKTCGREVQISQVLVNLINNSVDAIMSEEERWIKIVISDRQDYVEFKITDSGKGIPLALREKIMQPFFTTKDVGKGTGLGLSISKGIIKDHGGDFYYNEQSVNTEFVFTVRKSIPLALVA